MNLKDISEVNECPHCGNNFSYYQKCYVKGWIQDNTLFEDDPITGKREKYNYEMYDSLQWSREKRTCYCGECDKPIGTKKLSPY